MYWNDTGNAEFTVDGIDDVSPSLGDSLAMIYNIMNILAHNF